jgi:hypothetical protein
MPEFHHLNVNFNGGELTPLMNGRVDFDGYRSGCVQMENFMVRPYGGAFKTPGTQYLGEVKNSTKKVRIIPFKISRSESFFIEMGEFYFRFWKENEPAYLVTSNSYSIPSYANNMVYYLGEIVNFFGETYLRIGNSGGSEATFAIGNVAGYWRLLSSSSIGSKVIEWAHSLTEQDLADVQWKPIGRTLILVHPKYQPIIIESVPTDGSVKDYTRGSAWSDAFGITLSYSFAVSNLVFDFPPLKDHFYSDGGLTVTLTHGYPAWVTGVSMPIASIRWSRGILYVSRTLHTSSATSEPLVGATWTSFWYPAAAPELTYTLTASSPLVFAGLVAKDQFIFDGTATGTKTSLASTGLLTPSEPRFFQGGFSVSTEWASGAAPIHTLSLYQSSNGVTWEKVNEWLTASSVAGTILYTDKAPASGAFYRLQANVTTGSANAFAKLEPLDSVVTLPFVILWVTSSTVLAVRPTLNNAAAPNDVVGFAANTFYTAAFSAQNGYPRAIGLHNLRLWFGGTSKEPNKVRASNVDDFFNFKTSDLDDSGFDVTLNSSESNVVQWIAGYRQGLVIGTEGEEWTLQGAGDGSEVLKPTNIQAIQRNRSGSKAIAAIQTRDALLWSSLTGRKVFEFAYVFSTDDYKSPDMTLRAEHITESGIVAMSFQSEPDSILWCVLANGTLLGFSYNRENQIAAWFNRTTAGGSFEDVATVRSEGDADRVWFIVKRTINGVTKRYIERFYPTAQEFDFTTPRDFCYLDCAKKITLTGASVTGLSHLEGKQVTAYVDGKTTEVHTVTGGAITLNAASYISLFVGLPITSVLQPNPIEQVLRDGTAQGRHFNAQRLQLLLHASIGGTISNDPELTGDGIGYPTFQQTPAVPATSPATLILDFTGCIAGDEVLASVTVTNGAGANTSFAAYMFVADPGYGPGTWINTTSLANAAAFATAFAAFATANLPLGFTCSAVGNTARINTTEAGVLAKLEGIIDDYSAAASCSVSGGGFGFASVPIGPIIPFTGRLDEHITPEWQDAIRLTFKHSDPTPFNLLGFVLKAEISGS